MSSSNTNPYGRPSPSQLYPPAMLYQNRPPIPASYQGRPLIPVVLTFSSSALFTSLEVTVTGPKGYIDAIGSSLFEVGSRPVTETEASVEVKCRSDFFGSSTFELDGHLISPERALRNNTSLDYFPCDASSQGGILSHREHTMVRKPPPSRVTARLPSDPTNLHTMPDLGLGTIEIIEYVISDADSDADFAIGLSPETDELSADNFPMDAHATPTLGSKTSSSKLSKPQEQSDVESLPRTPTLPAAVFRSSLQSVESVPKLGIPRGLEVVNGTRDSIMSSLSQDAATNRDPAIPIGSVPALGLAYRTVPDYPRGRLRVVNRNSILSNHSHEFVRNGQYSPVGVENAAVCVNSPVNPSSDWGHSLYPRSETPTEGHSIGPRARRPLQKIQTTLKKVWKSS